MSSKSTFTNSTSRSYALAVYELAQENSELNEVENGMNSLKEILNKSSDFKEMILNPIITKEEKNKVITEIINLSGFCETLKKFLGFLINKNRLFYLNKIIDSFLNFVSIKKGELKAKLISSKKLSATELEKIRKELSTDFQSPIKIDYKHDPDLIAGLVIQIGSMMVDTSIKSKLRQLEKNMIEA